MASILVADDEEPIRFAFQLVLEEAGHSVVTVEDGVKVVKALQKDRFDMLITDIVMPNQDGIETILSLKKTYPDLPIIAISGGGRLGSDAYLDMASCFKVDAVLTKPITSAQLVETVNKVLAKRAVA